MVEFVVSDEELEDLIHNYCNDFTQLQREGRFDPITGRDDEVDQVVLILLQKGRKNACFLAPAGVGKTAAVVGLAQKIVSEDVPDYLKDARVLEIDMAKMAAGTNSNAEFQGRFIPLCKGVAERYFDETYPRFILFIDELHTIMPGCKGSAYAGLSEVMKPYLTTGALHVIGATTLDEFRIYVAEDPALDRRFQKVPLKVPNAEEAFAILQALRPGFEKHHKLTIPDEELKRIVALTDRYLRKRNQPDKSIMMLDASCAYHVKTHGTGNELTKKSLYYMMSKESGVHRDAFEE
jgi:ATP-dependent Clp protease ATP-binding subunit ClpA